MKNRNAFALHSAASSVIETLEQRRLLSTVTAVANPNPDVGGLIVKITGTNNTDTVTVYDDPANNMIIVADDRDHNNHIGVTEQHNIPVADESLPVEFDVLLKKGNDTFNFRLVSSYHGQQRSVEVDLGSGDDKFNFSSPTTNPTDSTTGVNVDPDGADIFFGNSPIDFNVEGESGNDKINFDLSRTSIDTARLNINTDTESGNDTVTLITPNAGSDIGNLALTDDPRLETQLQLENEVISFDAELRVQIDTGSGNDTINQQFNSEIHSSNVDINVLGGTGNDTYNDEEGFAAFEGSRIDVTADLGDGNDHYDAEFAFGDRGAVMCLKAGIQPETETEFANAVQVDSSSQVTFNILGGEGRDTLDVDGDDGVAPAQLAQCFVDCVGAPEANISGLLDIAMHGGHGNDKVSLKATPDGGIAAFGTVRAWLTGDDGSDKMTLDVVVGGPGQGIFDLSVQGNGDNDTIGSSFADESEFGTSLKFGSILIDGGKGTDTYDTETGAVHPAIFSLISVEKLLESLEAPIL